MINDTFSYPRIIQVLTNAMGQAIFAVIVFLAVLALDIFVYFFSPYDGLTIHSDFSAFGQVLDVLPGSPSEIGGVQTGDILLAVEDRVLDPWVSRPVYSFEDRAGDILNYTFERDHQAFVATILLGSNFENAVWFFPSFWIHLLSVYVWGTGTLLCLFANRNDVSVRLIGLTFLLASVTIAAGQAAGWNAFWEINTVRNILWGVLGPISVIAHLTFPSISFPKSYRRNVHALILVALLLSGLSSVEGWVLFPRHIALRETALGVGARELVLFFFILAQVMNVGLLIYHRYFSENPELRRQVGVILWSTVLGFIPFIALDLIPYLILGESYVGGWVTFLPVFLLPLTYSYLSYQHKLLKLDFIINRVVVLFSLALLTMLAALMFLCILTVLFGLSTDVPLTGSLVVVLFTLPSASMQKFIQRWVNQVLYGNHYDFESITSQFSGMLAKTLDRQALVEFLTRHLNAQMGIRRSTLFLLDEARIVCQTNGDEVLELGDSFCKTLQIAHRPLRASQLSSGETRSSLWENYRWGQVFVPLVLEGQLLGILVLGERIASDLYSDQDLAILATVAYQAALAYTNVQMVEAIRLSKQALIRSEYEYRKKLARDLHDTVLQEMFFIKKGLLKNMPRGDLAGNMDKVIREMRQKIEDQRSALLDQNLSLAFEGMVEEMRTMVGEKPAILFTNRIDRHIKLSEEQRTSLFRIAKEAVMNAWKHAHADQIAIRLEKTDSLLQIIVKDNGIGFSPSTFGHNTCHFGLVGMQERANLIHANFSIASQPGQGTTITTELKI